MFKSAWQVPGETSSQPTPKIQTVHASESELLMQDQNLRMLILKKYWERRGELN